MDYRKMTKEELISKIKHKDLLLREFFDREEKRTELIWKITGTVLSLIVSIGVTIVTLMIMKR